MRETKRPTAHLAVKESGLGMLRPPDRAVFRFQVGCLIGHQGLKGLFQVFSSFVHSKRLAPEAKTLTKHIYLKLPTL